MSWTALLNRKDNSFSDVRHMSTSERESMERATAEIDAEVAAALKDRKRTPSSRQIGPCMENRPGRVGTRKC